jgi:Tol biopolymer transport system component
MALPAGPTREITLSPDDKRLVVVRGEGSNDDLWLVDLPTGVFSRLTSSPGNESQAVWAPDSRRIAFVSNPTKGPKIHEMVIGSGKETTIFADGKTGLLEYWTRDGKQLLIRNGSTVSVIPAPPEGAGDGKAPERKPQVVFTAGYAVDLFSVSPDGKWVAYMSLETGAPEINVAAFPSFTDRKQISKGGASQPLWRGDGKELFFHSGAKKLMAAEVKPGATFETGPVRELFQSSIILSTTIHTYAVTRDGQRFLIEEPPGSGGNNSVEPLYVVVNWRALVK